MYETQTIEDYFTTVGNLLAGEVTLSEDPEVIASQTEALYRVVRGLGQIPKEKLPKDFYKEVSALYVQAYDKTDRLYHNKLCLGMYNERNFLQGHFGF